jgi:phosphatidate cytidylyltransferase
LSELAIRLTLGPTMFLLVGVIYWLDLTVTNGVLSAAVLGLLALLACHEYTMMFKNAGFEVARNLLFLFALALCSSALWFGWRAVDHELYPLAIATFGLLFVLGLRALAPTHAETGLKAMATTLLGFILVVWPLYLAQGLAIRHLPSLLFVVLVCKTGDSGAYLLGRAFGRHKLLPHISPGKTVEGSVASLAVSCLVAMALLKPLLSADVGGRINVTLTEAALVGIMLNVTAQIGDLLESLLKRRCHVKDSSKLLPAHGGILDLLDSLLFSFPAYFLALTILT